MALFALALFLLVGVFMGFQLLDLVGGNRGRVMLTWFGGNAGDRAALITKQEEPCPGAPFSLPTEGFIGLVYGDPGGPYSRARPHQGIDIFSRDRDRGGRVPVYAAYDGYVSREATWRSALIQRVPQDPLLPGRQIWLYYAHMAAEDGTSYIVDAFPPGAREVYVRRGTLLGYTGNYNGNSPRSIWVHLHFSIVKDDGQGRYLNELDFDNTLDPSSYLGMPLSFDCAPPRPDCGSLEGCSGAG